MKNLIRSLVLVVLAAAVSSAGNLSGKWKFLIELEPVGWGDPEFTFEQKGKAIEGRYIGALGCRPVKGSIEGDFAVFEFTYDRGGKPVRAIYTGILQGENRMTGKLRFDGFFGTGTWTAVRDH